MKEEKKEEGRRVDFCFPGLDVDREGWHVICGTTPENGISKETPLGLKGINSLVIADLDYFVEHNEDLLKMVKEQIENRNYFREHPEEWEKYVEACRSCQPFQRAFNQKIHSGEDVG